MARKSAAAAATKPMRMSDADFAELGRSYRAAATNVLQAQAKKDEYQERIIAELEVRGDKSYTVDDVLITRKRNRRRSFDIAAVRALLGKQAAGVIDEKVRPGAIDALVKAGVLKTTTIDVDGESVNVVEGIEQVTLTAPYIDVTDRKA